MSAATPPPRPWTVGDLRQALAGVPDDTPLQVDAAIDDVFCDEQVVVSAGFNDVVWQGKVETDVVFSIACELPPDDWPYSGCRYGSYRQTALDDACSSSSSGGAGAPDSGGLQPPPGSGPGADNPAHVDRGVGPAGGVVMSPVTAPPGAWAREAAAPAGGVAGATPPTRGQVREALPWATPTDEAAPAATRSVVELLETANSLDDSAHTAGVAETSGHGAQQ